MAKQIIAVDVDEVISVHAPSLVAFSNKRWGTHLTVEDFTENWVEMWGIDQEEVLKRHDVLVQEGQARNQPAMEGAFDVLTSLAHDYELVITTARRTVLMKDTEDWVQEHFPGIFRDLHFAGIWDEPREGGHLQTKADLLKKIGAHYLIDDQPKHCLAAAEIGIEALLFGNYPWNSDVADAKNVTRVCDWQAVKAYFDAKSTN